MLINILYGVGAGFVSAGFLKYLTDGPNMWSLECTAYGFLILALAVIIAEGLPSIRDAVAAIRELKDEIRKENARKAQEGNKG